MGDGVFSEGTDFELIQSLCQSEKIEGLERYIRNFQELQLQIAAYQKPVILAVNGEIRNTAASMALLFPFVYLSSDSTVSFDNLAFGLLPHGGQTYALNSLPDCLGKYLALTGAKIGA